MYIAVAVVVKHRCLRPLTPQSRMLPLDHCNLPGETGVNNLPKVATELLGIELATVELQVRWRNQ